MQTTTVRPKRTKKKPLKLKVHPTKKAHRTKDGVPDSRRINSQNRIRSTMTGTRTVDEAVHKLNLWLKELMEVMEWDNREKALSAFRATLQALRDLLPADQVPHLGAQLPLLFKAFYYDSWNPSPMPQFEVKNTSDFFDLVEEKLGAANYGRQAIQDFTFAVFEIMAAHMDVNELRKVKAVLRQQVRQLIPVSLDQ
jgi:uncharacterized protein (DUF2267 family)